MKYLVNSLAMGAIIWTTTAVSVAQDRGDIFPFPVTTFQLENGLQVVGVEYDSPGVVAFYTVVRAGSRNEVEPGFSGYAHFFEHMMFRGTERYPTDAYNAVIKRIGADSNAFTTNDWTAYTLSPVRMNSRRSLIWNRIDSRTYVIQKRHFERRPAQSLGSTT